MAKAKVIYTTCGPMRGPCRSVYKSASTATKSLKKDQADCESHSITADRVIFSVPASKDRDVRKGMTFRWLSAESRRKDSGVDRVAEAK